MRLWHEAHVGSARCCSKRWRPVAGAAPLGFALNDGTSGGGGGGGVPRICSSTNFPRFTGEVRVGIAVTAGTYVSGGLGAPERIGLTLAKVARRTGRLNPVLAVRVARDAVKVEKAGGLVDLVGDVGRIETKAGTQAALDSLKIAEGPRDVSRLARLSAAKGGKTRAIIKLLGRGAIMLAVSAFEVATWMLWAGLMLLGFVSSLKTASERMTLRYLRWRKARRVRAAELRVA